MEHFIKKADAFKRPLIHTEKMPCSFVEVVEDNKAFQGVKAIKTREFSLPYELKSGESVIFDFGEHLTGYLNFSLENIDVIADSPVKLRFSFGETPYEISKKPADYHGVLGSGWLQNEEKTIVFVPYQGKLDRRYAFRYLKIERVDNAKFSVNLEKIFCDSVSAVSMDNAEIPNIPDARMKKIYEISAMTLKECEQDVFEDGPKRDRRLWMGDLRLQALTDMQVFKNADLIKRCIYLFAGHLTKEGRVSSFIYPDIAPYVSDWCLADYSLFFISCLYDYMQEVEDCDFIREMYPVALEQVKIVSEFFETATDISEIFFIDWCPGLDKTVCGYAVYLYALRQITKIAEYLGEDRKFFLSEIKEKEEILKGFLDKENGFFVTLTKQLSWHSQIWAVLSGVLLETECRVLLENLEKTNPEIVIHTPYMMHYYIEALFACGMKDKAMEKISEYWGGMLDAGFDCWPEIFNPQNEFDSPYDDAVVNTACHAWSCTPAYWIKKYYTK